MGFSAFWSPGIRCGSPAAWYIRESRWLVNIEVGLQGLCFLHDALETAVRPDRGERGGRFRNTWIEEIAD